MNKLRNSIFIGIGIVLLGTSVVVANSPISDFFAKTSQQVENAQEITIVDGKSFTISEREFVQYKRNVLLVHEMNGIDFIQTNDQLIKDMIKRKLLLQYAKKQNVTISDQEVEEYALQQQELFSNLDDPDFNAIKTELAKAIKVSEEEYWTHPKTLKNYEEWLTIEKLITELYNSEQLNDERTDEDFKEELWKKEKSQISIKNEILDNIK
jgi:hypothetical protein